MKKSLKYRILLFSLIGLGAMSGFSLAGPDLDPVGPLPLETLDGDKMTMSNFQDKNAWVFVFLSARCPETDQQIGGLEELHEKYRFREILMVGICSNPGESGEELRTYCQRRGLRFPVYRDPERSVAEKFGATVTPEAFVLDSEGRIHYRGAVGEPLEIAVESLSQGDRIQTQEVKASGTPIDQPGPAREIDDPYGTLHFSSELIFEKAGDAAAHHCSTLTEAPNGDLLCLWYGGTYESADDQTLYLSRRKKGEREWSPPEGLVRNSLKPPGNAVIFTGPDRRVWIVWGVMEDARPIRRGSGWTNCRLLFRTSEDNGATWTEDKPFPWDGGRALPRNVPIELAGGKFLLPLSGEGSNGESGALAAITSDGGNSWKRSMALPGVSQPTVIQRSDGSLLSYLRTEPKIEKTESYDMGFTWTDPQPVDLKCPGAGIAMTRLDNGHLILVFNDSDNDRTPISVARSTDEGQSWEKPLELESNPGEYSYPCVIQTRDGLIHITYTFRRATIKHVEMNENWLNPVDRPN